MQECPVFIEQLPRIVDMRRNLVLMESRFPEEAARVAQMENDAVRFEALLAEARGVPAAVTFPRCARRRRGAPRTAPRRRRRSCR